MKYSIRFAVAFVFLGIVCIPNSFAQTKDDKFETEQKEFDAERLPDEDAPPEYVEDLIEAGELAWIQMMPNGKLLIQGTHDDDWIEVTEKADCIEAEIRDLAWDKVRAKRTYFFSQVQINEVEILAKAGNDRVANQTWVYSVTRCAEGCDWVETGGYKSNIIYGGPGPDYIRSYGSGTRVFGGSGDDGIFHGWGDGRLEGGPDNDFIDGGNGLIEMRGDGGDDILICRAGICNAKGGPGSDLLIGGPHSDRLWGDDLLTQSTDGADTIFGSGGDDYLQGGGGPDILVGGAGRDEMYGNQGDDSLFAHDAVSDYSVCGDNGVDTVCLDDVDPSAGIGPEDKEDCSKPEPRVPNPRFDSSKFKMIFGM